MSGGRPWTDSVADGSDERLFVGLGPFPGGLVPVHHWGRNGKENDESKALDANSLEDGNGPCIVARVVETHGHDNRLYKDDDGDGDVDQ